MMNDQSFAGPRRATTHALRKVFITGLELDASIGVWPEERNRLQRIRVHVEMTVVDEGPLGDLHGNAVCYDDVATRIEGLVNAGHINLVETLADRIADLCLADRRVSLVQIKVEKPGALAKASAVGVEVLRGRTLS
jgi:dihydroneopterin aldolase